MWHKMLISLCFLLRISSQSEAIYFPENNQANFSTLLEQSRNTDVYESTVDGIISRGVSKFTLSLQNYMSRTNHADNIVFAPVNIGGALALVLLASSGKTFDEISNILGLASGVNIHANSERVHIQIGRIFNKLDQTTGTTLEPSEEVKLATALFVQQDFPIRSVFKTAAEQIYRSEVLNVDFRNGPRAQNAINAWVSDRTHNKIKTMLDSPPPSQTNVIITSALYFKASWEKPFFAGLTRKRPFFVNGRDSDSDMMVEFMANGGLFPYYRDRVLDCEIMGFPYKENKSTLYVIMPHNSNKARLMELQNRLTTDDLERLADSTRYTQSQILFPKMTLESALDLGGALKEFGAKSLFDPKEANLALLSPGSGNMPTSSPGRGNGFGSGFQSTKPSHANQFVAHVVRNPLEADNNDGLLIFSRSGVPINCTEIFDPTSNITKCQEVDVATQKEVIYKKFGDKVGRRITRAVPFENIDQVRQLIGNENPGLYADQVLHKVYMEITESGTEAAAATSVSLTRTGDFTAFKVNQPFFFFIRNHETRLILFWGSVTKPSPHLKS